MTAPRSNPRGSGCLTDTQSSAGWGSVDCTWCTNRPPRLVAGPVEVRPRDHAPRPPRPFPPPTPLASRLVRANRGIDIQCYTSPLPRCLFCSSELDDSLLLLSHRGGNLRRLVPSPTLTPPSLSRCVPSPVFPLVSLIPVHMWSIGGRPTLRRPRVEGGEDSAVMPSALVGLPVWQTPTT